MIRPTFVVTVGTNSYDDGTYGPDLMLEIFHSSKVETAKIPVPEGSKSCQTAEEAVREGKAVAGLYMDTHYSRQAYAFEVK